eukprot:271081-Alexandrium_andersonii.AAC.1
MEVDESAAPSTPVGDTEEPASQGAPAPGTGPVSRWGRRVELSKRPSQAPHLAGMIDVEPEAPNIESHEDFPNLATPVRPTKAPPR